MAAAKVGAVEDPVYVLDPARAVERLYRSQATVLLGMLVAYTGDRAVAEDLLQEAFLRLQQAWSRLESEEAAISYVRRTAFNLARSRFRHLGVVRRYEAAAAPPSLGAPADDRLVLREDQRALLAALATLAPRQRACVVLRYYSELSEREVAETLEISVNSVKTHLRRGLERLERALRSER